MRNVLVKIFDELNSRIEAENLEREESGTLKIQPVEIQLLGQLSLLANEMAAQVLVLQRTNDMDALIKNAEFFVKNILAKDILPKYGLVFDNDSKKVWIPPDSHFDAFCEFKRVRVKLLDPESALVSKAIKSSKKNKILISEAIASEKFPTLIQRIQKYGGDLNYFLGDD